jgi:hypothetical protein
MVKICRDFWVFAGGRSTTRTCDPLIKSVLSLAGNTVNFAASRTSVLHRISERNTPSSLIAAVRLVLRRLSELPRCSHRRAAEGTRFTQSIRRNGRRRAAAGDCFRQSRTPSDGTDRRRMLIVWPVVAPSGSVADGDHVELRPTANTGLIDAIDVVGTNSRFTFRSLSVCKGYKGRPAYLYTGSAPLRCDHKWRR